MKQRWLIGWEFYLIAPIVVAVIAGALWLSGNALIENTRLGNAFTQLIRIVETAREMRVKEGVPPDRAAAELMERLKTQEIADVEPLSTAFMGKEGERAFITPWGYQGRAIFYPASRSIRLEVEAPAHGCRKLLGLYAEAVRTVGIRRVDVRSQGSGSSWRLVYEEPAKGIQRVIGGGAIRSGCGEEGQTLISLTFLL